MATLPVGPANPHVKASRGGEVNLMKFYCTTSATAHGSHFANFKPQPGRHTGTGYQSNFRPVVQYGPRLDEVDNPAMGRIVAGNYRTVFQRDFNRYGAPSGTEPLPRTAHQVPTGFSREKALSVPDVASVQRQFIDARLASTPGRIGVQPARRPLLHRLQGKDPVAAENAGYGPSAARSEYRVRYSGQPAASVDLARAGCGPKELSGFTSNGKPGEHVRHTEGSPYRGDKPGWMTSRPTGSSNYTTAYRPLQVPDGRETLPQLAEGASRDSGFSSGSVLLPPFALRNPADAFDKAGDMTEARLDRIAKGNPAEFINVNHPDNHSSMYKRTYLGKQAPDVTAADRIGNTRVGDKEPTGHVTNDDSYVYRRDNPGRFLTNYTTQFLEITPQGKDREGHVSFNTLPAREDGYSKSTQVQGSEQFVPARIVGNMDPYQAKSLVTRDRFYDDHTYDSKIRSTSLAA